ncbi:MAG: phage terminase small subunit P27 family [Caldilineaceae bacterium]
MAGRPPKPTHLKILQGNPGKRAINKAEPKPAAKKPSAPKHLTGEAKREWTRMSKRLYELGLLTEVDRAALAMYCTTWARYVRAEEELSRVDVEWVAKTDRGYQHQSAWLQVSNQAMKLMKGLLVEFGMTPSSRSKVTVTKEEEENPFDKFLGRRAA